MVSNFQWKPFWLATQLDPQNDWTGWQFRVNYDVFTQAPLQRKPPNFATLTGYAPFSSMAAFHGNTYKVSFWWAFVDNRKPFYLKT